MSEAYTVRGFWGHSWHQPNTYSKVFVTFFMSGPLKFFYFQAAGVVVEDFVQLIYRLITGRDLKDPPRLWTRMLGYVWVGFFLLFWTTPGWCYPAAVMNLGTT